MFECIAFKSSAPNELLLWNMAERFGWTLDYVRSVNMSDINDYIQITDGKAKAAEVKR